jgi:hypothetical protein
VAADWAVASATAPTASAASARTGGGPRAGAQPARDAIVARCDVGRRLHCVNKRARVLGRSPRSPRTSCERLPARDRTSIPLLHPWGRGTPELGACCSSGAKACAIRLGTPASVRQRERWVSRSLFPYGTVGLASDGVRARRPERTRRSPVSQGSALWTTSALAVGEVVRGLTRSSCEASCCWRAPVRRVDSRAGWSGVFGDPLHGVVAGPRRGRAGGGPRRRRDAAPK